MRSCKEVSRLISKSQEQKLKLMERAELKVHLMMCKHCRNFSKNVSTMRNALKGFASGKNEDSKPK